MSLRWDSNLSWMSTILFEMAFQHDGFGSLISFLFVLYVDALRSSEKKEGKNNSDDTSFQAIMTTTPSIFSRGGGWMCNQYNFNIPRVIFSFPSHNIALPLSSLPPGCSQFLATLSIILWSYSRVMYELRADTGEVQRLESGSDIMWAVRHYYHLKSPVFFAILLRQLTSPKRFGDWVLYVGFLFAYPPPFESPWDEGGNARARGDVNSIANA